MVDRPAWYPEGYPYPPVRAARSRLPFPIGPTLSLYEAARLVSGRHPYPILPDGITTLGPCWGLIAGESTGVSRRRHRPQRGKAAFEALQQKVMSGGIPAEMCRLAQPGTISDGGIDWLNVKVFTADVVRLCEERGWRVRFTCLDGRKPKGKKKPSIYHRKRAAVLGAFEALGREYLSKLLQKDRESQVIKKVAVEHNNLPVTDRYVRDLWNGH